MNTKNFLLIAFLQWVFFTALKICYFNYDIFTNGGVEAIAFWTATAIVAAAMVRRLGVINYMEAVFVMIVWSVGDAFSDLLITSLITGLDIFSDVSYWASLGVMNVVIFLVHKKRHIQVRHEFHAQAHGHKKH